MSSRPDSPPTPQGPTRHSYDALFGDEDAPPAAPPAPPAAAPPVPPAERPAEPTSYDDPVHEEPYRPAAAAAVQAEPADPVQPARKVDLGRESGEPEPVRAARTVDTGRLYHSAGAAAVADATGAIPALRDAPPEAAVDAATPRPPEPSVPEPPARVLEPSPEVDVTRYEAVAGQSAPAGPSVLGDADRGLTYLGAVTVIGVPTLLVGFAQALIWNRIGWLTGLVLLVTTGYAALTLRRTDHAAAVVVPSLAFLVTTLLAGQLTLTEGGSLLVREGFMIVRTLAENAPWVLGATLLAAVIVLVRRRRARGGRPSAL